MIRSVFAAWMALLGAVFGSALLCAAERWLSASCKGSQGWFKEWATGRSACDSCGHELGAADLIPVFSYLVAGGKCRYCGSEIPRRALGAEIAGAVAFGLVGWYYAGSWLMGEWAVFACMLLTLSFIDLQARIIPNKLLIAGVVNRLLWMPILAEPLVPTLTNMGLSLLVPVALLVVVLVFERLRGVEAMGGGDLKLLMVMALYLDWMSLVLAIFVACVLGLAAALITAKTTPGPKPAGTTPAERASAVTANQAAAPVSAESPLQRTLPFGPALAAGCILAATVLQPAVAAYVTLLL